MDMAPMHANVQPIWLNGSDGEISQPYHRQLYTFECAQESTKRDEQLYYKKWKRNIENAIASWICYTTDICAQIDEKLAVSERINEAKLSDSEPEIA